MTTITLQGGDASENDVGGAVTGAIVGNVASAFNLTGGAAATDAADPGGVGGAIIAHTTTGTTVGAITLQGGAGAAGVLFVS